VGATWRRVTENSEKWRYRRAVNEFGKRLMALDERVFRVPLRGLAYDVPPPFWARPTLFPLALLPGVVMALYFLLDSTVSRWVALSVSVLPAFAYFGAVVTWILRHRQREVDLV
jgi:hypothetical protein